jgi:hypothetical protein
MRTIFLVSVLAALISFAHTVNANDGPQRGRAVARDPTRVRPPRQAPPKYENKRALVAPRQSPKHDDKHDNKHDKGNQDNQYRRDRVLRRDAPSPKPGDHDHHQDNQGNHDHHQDNQDNQYRRDRVLRRAVQAEDWSQRAARSQQEQDVFGGQRWGEDRCPAPLSACAVGGACDADAFECVDFLSDLSSCGGCAVDDVA